jgi:hypothetical protein
MGPLSITETEGYPPHHLAAASAAGTSYHHHHPSVMGGPISGHSIVRAIPLLHLQDRHPNLTQHDNVACQNIEVFEATPDIIAEYESSRRQAHQELSSTTKSISSSTTSVSPRQVGMRCIHCRKYPQAAPPTTLTARYRIVFPPSLASMADLVRKVADHHLASCRMAPADVQEVSRQAATKRQEQRGQRRQQSRDVIGDKNKDHDDDYGGDYDDDETRAALIDFCIGFCHQVGIANKQQHKSGLEYMEDTGGTPAARHGHHLTMGRAGGAPSSIYLDRTMGGPGYAKPPYVMNRLGMGPVVESPSRSIAPTPLQRTRDRPAEEAVPISTGRSNTPSSMGFTTPHSSQLSKGGTSEYRATGDIPTPAQPVFERRGSIGGGSAYPTPASGTRSSAADVSPRGEFEEQQQYYDLPSNFPFYQERDGTWHCKFCANVPPQYRDPQAIWGSRDGGPPPGGFIDQHLGICRGYNQGYPIPPAAGVMMHPSAGGFGMTMPPFGWEGGQMPYPPPVHDYPYGYPPPGHLPSHLEPSAAGSGHYIIAGPGPDAGGMYPGARSRPSREATDLEMTSADAEVMNHAMDYLVQFDKNYYEKDSETASIPKLVLDEDRLLLTDYFFFLMKQLRLCRFSEADRKTRGGKREKIKLGYGGLQCIHCSDLPMSRKFFWSNVDRLANSFAEIPGHVLKCKRCPPQCKDALVKLKSAHSGQMAKLPRGSQKVFFRRMWARLHDGDPKDEDEEPSSPKTSAEGAGKAELSPRPTVSTDLEKNSPESHKSPDISPSSGQSEETALVVQRTAKEAAEALAAYAKMSNPPGPPSPSSRVLLAIPEDKDWLSEKDIFIRKQLEVFCATEEDVAAARADLKYPVSVGQVGIRCIHCALAHGSDAVGHAIAYPFTISGIHESVREIHRLHLDTCKNLPAAQKVKLQNLGASSLSSVLRRYYVLGAKALGLRDTKSAGIRSGGESSPIGSQAAFTFAETEGDEETNLEDDEAKIQVEHHEEDSKLAAETKASEEKSGSLDLEGAKRSSDAENESEPPTKMARRREQGGGE